MLKGIYFYTKCIIQYEKGLVNRQILFPKVSFSKKRYEEMHRRRIKNQESTTRLKLLHLWHFLKN